MEKYLLHIYQGETLVCLITETEGYNCVLDKACHAFGNRQTPTVLYLLTGHAYIFLIYGVFTIASLLSDNFFIFENEQDALPKIGVSPRINIAYAKEYIEKPWRFFHKQYVKK